MVDFFSEKTIKLLKTLNVKTNESHLNTKWLYRSEIVKILLLHVIKRRMSINRILNKKDRNYIRKILIDDVGIQKSTEKLIFENVFKLIKKFQITKYNCTERYIEDLFKNHNIKSQASLVNACAIDSELSKEGALIKKIKEQVCGKLTLKKNKKTISLKDDYRPSKYDLKTIKLIIESLENGLKERIEFNKAISKKHKIIQNNKIKLKGWNIIN
ncbi:hypothetical protein OAD33_06730 [Alphaproteobacteria bacterium]|nr:hypothetical protein [Alphaproteobacteria bacterium]